jgi:tetratricopeptide (TPR) repeat protein
MLNSSIFNPDDPRWIDQPRHNPKVSRLLAASFARIVEGARNPLAYAEAHRLAARCIRLRRSAHQNMLVNVALGLSLESMNHDDMASEAFSMALDSANETGDRAVFVELHDQLGATLRCRGRYEEAASFYQDGLLTLEEVLGAALLHDPLTRHFELGLAVSLTAIGEYEEALQHLAVARELARQAGDAIALAGVDATTANVYTTRGDAHAALPLYLAAHDAYSAHAATPSERRMLGRMHAITALGLLDVAEVYARRGVNVQGSTYVDLAGTFAQRTLNYVVDVHDPGGLYLGLIARARHERISGRMSSAIHLIEPLLADADRIHDPFLAVQMHTAIGQDHAARGEHERAREAYQRAFQGASACGATYLGEYPKRELLRGSYHLS